MIEPRTLETRRLRLRPLQLSDAPAIQQAAVERAIADTMISIAHPYPDGEAERFIVQQQAELAAEESIAFSIIQKSSEQFCGLVEIRDIDWEHWQGELSFWLNTEAWGQGYMTEAIAVVVRYGFANLCLNRLYAHHMVRNPACGRVLQRNGFQREGILRERVQKWGKFEDVALWAILHQQWCAPE